MAGCVGLEGLSIQDSSTSTIEEEEIQHLTNRKTIEFLSKSGTKVLVIMRGVPGTGKSTLVHYLMEKLQTNSVCSADQHFMKNGKYCFDRNQLKQAHEACKRKAEECCQQHHPVVIIDNTNVKAWETNDYVSIANRCGYVVFMVTPKAQFTTSARELARRNKHDVDSQTIEKKLEMFDKILPSYFAWFFSERATARLAETRDRALASFKALGLFKFAMSSGVNTIAHLTSLYVHRSSNEHTRETEKTLMKDVGELDTFDVTAIVVTKRTVSARINLNDSAKRRYFNDETSGNENHMRQSGFKELPRAYAAHITLGKAIDVQSAVAKSDITLSRLCESNRSVQKKVQGNVTFYPEEELAVVVLERPVAVTGIFAAYYAPYRHRRH